MNADICNYYIHGTNTNTNSIVDEAVVVLNCGSSVCTHEYIYIYTYMCACVCVCDAYAIINNI